MPRTGVSLQKLMFLCLSQAIIPFAAWSQAGPTPSRIVDAVNEGALVTLRGNTHPLAQPRFDRGAAPPDLPMSRMLLVLKRSTEQESALQKLLDDQQDQNSPSYHQWLTPDQFGQQFGPSDADVQAIVAWLRSHGFQVATPSRGRTVIEFSGTAAQVQQAFHTEIHKYTVNGEDHWANASDPQIPAALTPVVEGVASLHNFPKKPMYRLAGKFSRERATGRVTSLGSQFTTVDSNICPGLGNCYFLGPYDFATIYNVLPLWNAAPAIDGTGQSIAIADESNINVQDIRDFRNLFAMAANDPQIIVDGIDPGLVPGAETEALLDVEWAGAVAKGATIKLVVAAPTIATQGADLASLYAIENNLAPVVSESFGECELAIGTAGNSFENSIRQQASAQGITFITAAGDQGSATCDGYSGTTPEPATSGLAVSGLASSPYGVAVGGTDFLNFGPSYNFNSTSPYWSATNNNTTQASALRYVPETTWNDTCTNIVFVVLGAGATPEASCNNPQLSGGVVTVGGGGGKSSCTVSNGTSPSNCLSGYRKPSWQAAPGVPPDSARDIPDISLFSADGLMTSAYILCEADVFPGHGSCSLNQPNYTFLGIGGTSGSAPAFAGMIALVNQFTQSSGQGNANYVLYKLASSSAQTSQNCNATATPAAGCIFHDVTSGTIAMPCAKSSPNCIFSNASDTYGVLSGYNASAGYDLATGLGSVNADNLVHNWIQPSAMSTTTLSLNGGVAVSITHGQSIPFDITVTPSVATGVVSLVGQPSGNGTANIPVASFPLQNGAATGTTTALAGGKSYSVTAHYSGDGTYKPSDSSPPITVTVAPEPSKTLITVPVFNPNTGIETTNTPTSVVYGTLVSARVDVGNLQATTTFPPQLVCVPLTCPTGNVTLTDKFNGTLTTLSPAGGFPLTNGGYAEDDSVPILSGGMHLLAATYSGDNSYTSSTGSYNLTVSPAPTQMPAPYAAFSPPTFIVGTPGKIIVEVGTNLDSGAEPTGTISFYDGTTQLLGTVSYFGGKGFPGIPASLQGTITATFATNGAHQISANYSGDANYAAATSQATSISAFYATTTEASANSTNINLGQSVTITATAIGASKSPPMTGTFQFVINGSNLSPTTTMSGTDASGSQTLTATITAAPQFSQDVNVNYSGDSNYAFSSGVTFVGVNIPDFSLNAPASPLVIPAGQSGSIAITVVPASNIASAVNISCIGNVPVGYNCSVSPATVDLNNGANGSFTLSLAPNISAAATTPLRAITVRRHGGYPNGIVALRGLSCLLSLMALLFLIWPAQSLGRRMKAGFILIWALCLALGCGTGSSSGSGGGPPPPPPSPQPTTTTVTTGAAKVAIYSPVTFTATVTGSNKPTGTVDFYLNGNWAGEATLVGNSAVLSTHIAGPGIYTLTAQYIGDSLNNPSISAGVNQAATGSTVMSVEGQTSTITHYGAVIITLQ
ncbi:MAG TPA: Ig-like domain repeat protein [Candidatus Acidoferrales bacterium]|nr:Ig-like domain repeat protein [Candidatus Acidoferrales bacterium]